MLSAQHGALYRLLAVNCPEDCRSRFTVPSGQGRLRLRLLLEKHLAELHGQPPSVAADIALRLVPRGADADPSQAREMVPDA